MVIYFVFLRSGPVACGVGNLLGNVPGFTSSPRVGSGAKFGKALGILILVGVSLSQGAPVDEQPGSVVPRVRREGRRAQRRKPLSSTTADNGPRAMSWSGFSDKG